MAKNGSTHNKGLKTPKKSDEENHQWPLKNMGWWSDKGATTRIATKKKGKETYFGGAVNFFEISNFQIFLRQLHVRISFLGRWPVQRKPWWLTTGFMIVFFSCPPCQTTPLWSTAPGCGVGRLPIIDWNGRNLPLCQTPAPGNWHYNRSFNNETVAEGGCSAGGCLRAPSTMFVRRSLVRGLLPTSSDVVRGPERMLNGYPHAITLARQPTWQRGSPKPGCWLRGEGGKKETVHVRKVWKRNENNWFGWKSDGNFGGPDGAAIQGPDNLCFF